MSSLTLFNCGTGSHRDSDDVVPELFKLAESDCCLTDGVGTNSLWTKGERTTGHSGLLLGNVFAADLDANVALQVEAVRRKWKENGKHRLYIDMLGWSRGAVTCYKIANALDRDKELAHQDIPVRIFAIDPVPGSSGRFNSHMWANIEMTQNIKACVVVLAQHDYRRTFNPVLPASYDGDFRGPRVIKMPGNHAGIVKPIGNRDESYKMVKDLALRFLSATKPTMHIAQAGDRGGHCKFTNGDALLLDRNKILACYAEMDLKFNEYRQKSHYNLGMNLIGLEGFKSRTVRTQDSDGSKNLSISRKRDGFFINIHHMEVFRQKYPALFYELTSFSSAMNIHGGQWGNELRRLETTPGMQTVVDSVKRQLGINQKSSGIKNGRHVEFALPSM